MKGIITQSNYIPWKGYFDSIGFVDKLVVYDEMQYTKRDWRNRNKIQTSNGLQWLSVPVSVKGKFFQKISETQISENGWAEKHYKTFYHNYSKAPHFSQYQAELKKKYEEAAKKETITEVNLLFINWINHLMKIDTQILDSASYQLVEDRNQRLVDICLAEGITDYYSGKAAQFYLDENLFAEAGIKVHWWDYSNYPHYAQLSEPFEHGVTALDLLFNVGPDSVSKLKYFGK